MDTSPTTITDLLRPLYSPFTDFLATLVRANLEGKPGPNVPVK